MTRAHRRHGVLCQPGPVLDREPCARRIATITYSVTADNPDTGDTVLANTVTSAAAGSNCASGSTDPRCTATVDLVAVKTLTFTNGTNVASTTAGGVVVYTITAANSGLTAYGDATFTDNLTGVLANAAYDNDASATAGTVSPMPART